MKKGMVTERYEKSTFFFACGDDDLFSCRLREGILSCGGASHCGEKGGY